MRTKGGQICQAPGPAFNRSAFLNAMAQWSWLTHPPCCVYIAPLCLCTDVPLSSPLGENACSRRPSSPLPWLHQEEEVARFCAPTVFVTPCHDDLFPHPSPPTRLRVSYSSSSLPGLSWLPAPFSGWEYPGNRHWIKWVNTHVNK